MKLTEFKPTIFFLLRFVGLYVVGNVLYGWYITSYHPRPDPITHAVAVQTSAILNVLNWSTEIKDHPKNPTTRLLCQGHGTIAIYEGCNGVNTAIIFLSFVVGFGPLNRRCAWFCFLGLVVIHLANLGRLITLFFVSEKLPHLMFFTHKYLFTAILYGVIVLLWMWWVRKIAVNPVPAKS